MKNQNEDEYSKYLSMLIIASISLSKDYNEDIDYALDTLQNLSLKF